VEFSPSTGTKWLNIKECKNNSNNENVLTKSSHKMKIAIINDIKNTNYYHLTTII
jgi:hypothetical protein